ncbi:major facilitator superfamily domain-containing protein [Sporodiniella umbellata]|nr:major facilitator superfamily domain-containing protein [Sporodiniella umbellata]
MEVEEVTPLLPPKVASPFIKPSPWYIIFPMFAIAFTQGCSIVPKVEALSIVYCHRYYQPEVTDGSGVQPEQCNIPEIQSMVSKAQALIIFLGSIAALLLAGYYGALSDRKGRRLVLKISMIGGFLYNLCNILTLSYQTFFGVCLLYIGPFLRGILAGDAILIAAANAYLSDCTHIGNRTLMFSRMIAFICLGNTLGSSFSSFLVQETGDVLSVFYLVLLIHALLLAYMTCILPESNEYEEKFVSKPMTFLERINILSTFRIVFQSRPEHVSRYALPLIMLIQMTVMVFIIPPTILYGMLKFGWTSFEGGLFISSLSSIRLIILALFVPIVSYFFKKYRGNQTLTLDIWLIRFSFFVDTIAFIVYALVSTPSGYMKNVILHGISVVSAPAIRSLASSLVDPSLLGQFWGVMATVETISMILCQLVVNLMYSATVATMPNFTFFFIAGIAAINTVIAFCVYPVKSRNISA